MIIIPSFNCRSNYKELGLVLLFLGMGSVMFASLVYVFESDDDNSHFKTMLDAYWWSIITMTTVGYGDVYPITGMGKVIASLCAIFGVLVIGLPIPIIGNSFNNFYAREKRQKQKLKVDKLRFTINRKMLFSGLNESEKSEHV